MRLLRLFVIITVLGAYTAFKIIQTAPTHWSLAVIRTALLFAIMIVWLFSYSSFPSLIAHRWFRMLAWMGSLTMGIWASFILLAIPIDIALGIYHIFSSFNLISAYGPLLPQKINLVLLAISGGIAGFGLFEVIRGPRVKEVVVSISDLPEALENFSIAQISDLHVGLTITKNYVEKVVRRTNATNPDLLVVTGDLADAKLSLIAHYLQPLAYLKAHLGIYFVTGNHEYYWNVEDFLDKTTSLGFQPLINEHRIIDINNTKVMIAGITDLVGTYYLDSHQPDIAKAAETTENPQFKILLAHRPDTCIEAERYGFDLQLSGHTHAGQFFPFNLLIPLAHKYYRNLNQHGRLWLYVNPGTGYWGPANRFGIPAEITLLKLKRKV